MNRYIFPLFGVVIALVIITSYMINLKASDPNEVFGANFHGYYIYEYFNPDRTKNREHIKKLISEFEFSVPTYISSSLKELDYCHDEVMAELGKYKRYYKFKFNESSETIQTIFTFLYPIDLKDFEISSDPSFSDGGISQFRVDYDFKNKVFTSFNPNYGEAGCLHR
jgi:hypothetical protein